MAEPKTTRGRQTRERIISTAAHLMHVRGVHATTIDEVLAASGAGKSQIYHYFGSKLELVRAVLRLHAERIFGGSAAMLARLDSWAGIEAWFRAIVHWHRDRGCVGGCPIGSMAAEMADRDSELRRELDALMRIWEERLTVGLARMQERGELRHDADPEGLAAFTVAVQQGGILRAKTAKDVRPLENAFAHALAYLRSYAPG